jgi:hypothetical protein
MGCCVDRENFGKMDTLQKRQERFLKFNMESLNPGKKK